jgi:20S proteasome subunit beta 2
MTSLFLFFSNQVSIRGPDCFKSDLYFFRNAVLESKGMGLPTAKKTGTTIAGCIFKDGVILAADSRATSGSIIADPDCKKIYALAPNML